MRYSASDEPQSTTSKLVAPRICTQSSTSGAPQPGQPPRVPRPTTPATAIGAPTRSHVFALPGAEPGTAEAPPCGGSPGPPPLLRGPGPPGGPPGGPGGLA